eukprot:CAMPEP_0114110176 /NCGR_PEP_ID=MMETSP0043_2-20121206/1173_1 /TAXON_ID=464988 /ORGANISM="Hemiselmis andersenii, Strain CCMP644" /LENGTH=95 /DNA_ID=CAMNT_0001202109 /DNA_START=391 /DNA_END=675 /DNA_ORIENTATION=-
MEKLPHRPAYVGLSRQRGAAHQLEEEDPSIIGADLEPEVRELLVKLGLLEKCASAFETERVGMAALAGLADGNLQALGVVRMGDRHSLQTHARAA